MSRTLKIATRSSKLALWQANWVKEQIEAQTPEVQVELIQLKTKGDKILDTPLAKIGGKGLFVKELENAILAGEADIAVHSMKDVPVALPTGLEISVITKREEPSDAFVSNQYDRFEELPEKAVVGTSSLRRIAQLQRLRPDISFVSLRGNVDTRLRKLDEGNFDAIILAGAGLIRLGLEERIKELLSFEQCLPAIAQGAVGIESRVHDTETLKLINPLMDIQTAFQIQAERALLAGLDGGCQIPLGGYADIREETIHLTGYLGTPDGSDFIKMTEEGPLNHAVAIGSRLATKILKSGGRKIQQKIGLID